MSDDIAILLARIDERSRNIEDKLARLEGDLKELRSKVNDDFFQQDKRIRDQYITKDSFMPVQRAMFTAMTTIVAAVVMAVLNFTFR